MSDFWFLTITYLLVGLCWMALVRRVVLDGRERRRREQADAQNRELREALDKSVELQSHYAGLLNQYDGGQRIQFEHAEAWLERLRVVKGNTVSPPHP